MTILQLQGLKKSFGGLMAVAGVNLKVEEGRIQSVIGPNGAGKTTLFNLITGFYSTDEGRVIFKGKDITGLPPQEIVRMGIGRSFQVTNIFPKLTVLENVQAAVIYAEKRGLDLFHGAKELFAERAGDILSLVDLGAKAAEMAGTLSAGDMKRLELAIVLATNPDLLLLDEPTCGMSPVETATTVDLIQEIAEKRTLTVLFTEHKLDVVFSVSAHITVMNFGAVIAAGKPDEIRSNEKVQKVYFGEMDVSGS